MLDPAYPEGPMASSICNVKVFSLFVLFIEGRYEMYCFLKGVFDVYFIGISRSSLRQSWGGIPVTLLPSKKNNSR